MISRRHTREYLLSTLYTRSFQKEAIDFPADDIYFDANFLKTIDKKYLKIMMDLIQENEVHLLSIIHAIAPKFELDTMPRIHIAILFIALTEILYWQKDDINEKIAVNEALELAKSFSDTHGKNFVHGVLSTFLKNREKYENPDTVSYRFFS